jgi:hypothetical protein
MLSHACSTIARSLVNGGTETISGNQTATLVGGAWTVRLLLESVADIGQQPAALLLSGAQSVVEAAP